MHPCWMAGCSAAAAATRTQMAQTVLAAALLMSIKERVYLSTRAVMLGAGGATAAAVAAG